MLEIETEPIGCHERSCLLHVVPEDLAKRGVQQMSGRVISARRVSRFRVDFGRHDIAHMERFALDANAMDAWIRAGLSFHLFDGRYGSGLFGPDLASIVDLTA